MILIVKICEISFHYFEFVKPIEDVLKRNNINFETVHFKDLNSEKIKNAYKVIICGTSLKDNSFIENVDKFSWLKDFNKPVLGICGGMHLLGLVFDGELKKAQEIGLNIVEFDSEFLGLTGEIEVYDLHNFYAESNDFDITANSKKCPQAFKHKNKPFFGVLFFPEVRNKKLIECFIKVKN